MDKNENVYDNVIENVKFIDKTEIKKYFGQEDKMNCLKTKKSYLSLSAFNFTF